VTAVNSVPENCFQAVIFSQKSRLCSIFAFQRYYCIQRCLYSSYKVLTCAADCSSAG